jgi:hypothetical protein
MWPVRWKEEEHTLLAEFILQGEELTQLGEEFILQEAELLEQGAGLPMTRRQR